MEKLTKERAVELLKTTTKQPHLFQHAIAVSCAMGAMAKHFGEDENYWAAVGYLHDYDYEQFPDEHLQHTKKELETAGVDEDSIRAILAHGYGLCSDVKPEADMEKSLFTMDNLTGLVSATAKMRPTGVTDLTPSSVTKKFKDKHFASGVNRETINKGLEMLNMERDKVIEICIEGMKKYAKELDIDAK